MPNSSNEFLSNLTFKDLNELIDQWTMDIQEYQKVFALQASEMNKVLLGTCIHHEKLKPLHKRVILAQCFEWQMDINIGLARSSQNVIENHLTQLEEEFACSCRNMPQDVYRKNTYEVAEQINIILINIEQALNLLESYTYQTVDYNENFDIGIFTNVLQLHLGQLENIEIKTYQLADKLAEALFHKQHLLKLLNMRENPLV